MKISDLKKYIKLRRKLLWIGAMVIGTIVGLVVSASWDKIKAFFESEPYVAVLVSTKTIDFDIPKDFIDGFNHARMEKGKHYFSSKNNDKIQIRYEEDFLSKEKTAIVSEKLNSDDNCILIIGNSNSTLTSINLDVLMASNNKVPFIIPIATDETLLKKAESVDYKAVLRMLPHNGKQSDAIERLVSKLATNRKVAIYGDEDNQSYSINLLRDIANKVRKKGGTIVIEELIGPTNSFYNSIVKWTSESKHPEVIVYVGVSHHGLLFLDQISELDISVPIIFTDGCLVTSLLSNISKYTGRAFILSPAEFTEEDMFLPSYKHIGEDAFTLASSVIKRSDGTRNGVRNLIANNKKDLGFFGKAGRYGFSPHGENEEGVYFVYEIKGGKLERFTNY
ncbi:MAG: hypothetical protein KAS96_06020 [Planctomycetes bacterium]|nr:hypothetical protein [Planctomycetota bacterium]